MIAPMRNAALSIVCGLGKGRNWLSAEGRRPLGSSDERNKPGFPLRAGKFPCRQSTAIAVRRNIEPCDRIDCKTGRLESATQIFDGLNLFEHRCMKKAQGQQEASEKGLRTNRHCCRGFWVFSIIRKSYRSDRKFV
jgi:hypothetical protein